MKLIYKLIGLLSKPKPKNITNFIKEKPKKKIEFYERLSTKLEWEKTFYNSFMWDCCVPISIYKNNIFYACWDKGQGLEGVSLFKNQIKNNKRKSIDEELFDFLFKLDEKPRERFLHKIKDYLKFGYTFEKDISEGDKNES